MYPWTEYQTNLVKTQTQTSWIPEFQQQGHCLTQYNQVPNPDFVYLYSCHTYTLSVQFYYFF